MWEFLALGLILALFASFLWVYFEPAFFRADSNGYHTLARAFAQGRISPRPHFESSFLGEGWVLTEEGNYVSKYAPFYPAMVHVLLRAFGDPAGLYVTPLCALLAIAGVYALGRSLGLGSASLLVALGLATSPVFAHFALIPFAHMASVAALVFAFTFLFSARESQADRKARLLAVFAGLCLGVAVGVRYTNVVFLIPVVLTLKHTVSARRRDLVHGIARGLIPPFAVLAWYHTIAFGAPWTTGYGATGEQTGFALGNLVRHLPLYVIGFVQFGLGPMAALTALACGVLWKWAPKRASLYIAWGTPVLVLYSAYYWAPHLGEPGPVRMLLPALVPALLAAVTFLCAAVERGHVSRQSRRLAGVALAVVQMAWGIPLALQVAEGEARVQREQAVALEAIRTHVPRGAAVFAKPTLANFVQYSEEYPTFCLDLFERGRLEASTNSADGPSPLQAERARLLREDFVDVSAHEHRERLFGILEHCYEQEREVYIVCSLKLMVHLLHTTDMIFVELAPIASPPWSDPNGRLLTPELTRARGEEIEVDLEERLSIFRANRIAAEPHDVKLQVAKLRSQLERMEGAVQQAAAPDTESGQAPTPVEHR